MVLVKLFANFREAVGAREIELDAKNVSELIWRLVSDFPQVGELVKREEYLHVMINGVHFSNLDRFDTPLKKDDVVAIFPPVSGGQ